MDNSRIGPRRQWVHSAGHSICWLKLNTVHLVNTSACVQRSLPLVSLLIRGTSCSRHAVSGLCCPEGKVPSPARNSLYLLSLSEWSPLQGTERPFLSCCYPQAYSMTLCTIGGSCGQDHGWRRAWSQVPPGCLLAARDSCSCAREVFKIR